MMRVTIKDIAKESGYSVTTVSLVLNNKADHIPVKTRDIVLSVAKELNYRPNQLAVSMVTKRTNTIGLIVSDIRNLFFSTLAKGVEEECRKNGWNLILCNTNDSHERDLDYIQVLADKQVDGILFCMSIETTKIKAEKSIDLIRRNRIPFILMDRYLETISCSSITVDHERGGYLATEYLIKLGHNRIGCITGPTNLTDSVKRLDGYKAALKSAQIIYDSSIVREGDYSTESGYKHAKELIEKGVSAIFAFNDLSAFGVYNRAKKMKINIPNDLSIVGYDDVFFSEILDVPLSTIHQPIYEMGVEGAKQLINFAKNGQDDDKHIVFLPNLVIRDSATSPNTDLSAK